MAKIYLLDSTVVIDYLRGKGAAINFIQLLEKPVISVLTVGELYQGVTNKKELLNLKKILQNYYILQIKETISETAIKLVEEHVLASSLYISDALIAATAKEYKLTLATASIKHFKAIKGLKLEKL